MKGKILFILGTRPEAIKLAPLIKYYERYPYSYELKICVTGQHREMLDHVLKLFQITPDFDLNVMTPNQSLATLTAKILLDLQETFQCYRPDIVFVQGDTTTAFIGSLISFYEKIEIAHIEAGLRSNSKFAPFPEEINRTIIGHIADYHFAPTQKAAHNLYNEGIQQNVWVVGNTVIDALLWVRDQIKKDHDIYEKLKFFFRKILINETSRLILVTGHRRESFGEPFKNICYALLEIVKQYKDVEIIYPVHLNPNVQNPVNNILKNHPRIHLTGPLDYLHLVWLMDRSYLVLTDSGGIQEEAPSLGKPVLVMRDVTERKEGIEAGTAKLVGTDKDQIVSTTLHLLENDSAYQQMANAVNPYGDGQSSKRIYKILDEAIRS